MIDHTLPVAYVCQVTVRRMLLPSLRPAAPIAGTFYKCFVNSVERARFFPRGDRYAYYDIKFSNAIHTAR